MMNLRNTNDVYTTHFYLLRVHKTHDEKTKAYLSVPISNRLSNTRYPNKISNAQIVED